MMTPELALIGYLPRDLPMSERSVRRAGRKPAAMGRPLFHCAALPQGGAAGPAFHKMLHSSPRHNPGYCASILL
jgi:NAD+ synthase/NAD+ synthase (glutamine-hydrolysing)